MTRFADGIVLFGKSEAELQVQEMMHDLNCESNVELGLKINKTKIKVMANRSTTIKVKYDHLDEQLHILGQSRDN